MNRPEDNTSREMGEGYALMTAGITFAVAVALFVLGGIWLDHRLGTLPLFTILGTIVGIALASFWLWQQIKKQAREDDAQR